MRVTVTGATGLIGRRLVQRLRERGDEVTVLSRHPGGADAVRWNPSAEAAPPQALSGRDGLVHLAGEPVAQRWNEAVKRSIRDSRELGTRNLVEGLRSAQPRPGVLVCASGVDFYGDRGDAELREDDPPGDDFLAQVCVAWEREAQRAEELGMRVVRIRTAMALSAQGGALAKMLPPFKLGIGGPVAGGRQWTPWIHLDDLVGMYIAALDDDRWAGPVIAAAPQVVTNGDFSKALGRALRRPAVTPVPAFALRLLYGDMAQIVTASHRASPERALELGYQFIHPRLDEALRSALGE